MPGGALALRRRQERQMLASVSAPSLVPIARQTALSGLSAGRIRQLECLRRAQPVRRQRSLQAFDAWSEDKAGEVWEELERQREGRRERQSRLDREAGMQTARARRSEEQRAIDSIRRTYGPVSLR